YDLSIWGTSIQNMFKSYITDLFQIEIIGFGQSPPPITTRWGLKIFINPAMPLPK
ncbi:hypothetical protein HMPREF9446_02692, partial [Bacteroides fluxus YIT 12057]